MKKIGMRNIKSAIGAAIAIIMCGIVNLITGWPLTGFFAAITVIIAMQMTLEMTFQRAMQRVTGCLIGGFIAFIGYAIFGNMESIFISAIICGLFLVATIYVITLINHQFAVLAACVIIIGTFTIYGDDVPFAIMMTTIETIIGALVVYPVNKFIFPHNPEQLTN